MKTDYLFVYGTLMKASENAMHRLLLPHCKLVSRAWILGKLYQIHHYPGVVESKHAYERVYGELYQLSNLNHVLAQLDDYEECSAAFPTPHEYQRKRVTVYLSENKSQQAWAYIYAYPVSEQNRIVSGDFLER